MQQAHRRKKKKRPTYMRNIRSLFLEADEDNGRRVFGFTLSGREKNKKKKVNMKVFCNLVGGFP